MSNDSSVTKNPDKAAHEAVLELIKATGPELFKGKSISAESGSNAANCLIAFHKAISDHYKTLG